MNQAKAAAATVAELRDALASARKEVVVAKSAAEALRISLSANFSSWQASIADYSGCLASKHQRSPAIK
jgi:hypothetical protein